MTYELLAERTGLSRATIESLGSRRSYNARLSTIENVCRALGLQPGDLLELDDAMAREHDTIEPRDG